MYMVTTSWIDVYHFSQSQIYDGGYTIRTSIDDAKMAALYQAVIAERGADRRERRPVRSPYMHAGAVLENPLDGAIQALYPGPGYPGAKYNGTGKVITKSYCKKIDCEVNMAVYNREQVGSSFKPYILATAVKQGMNVKTSTLDGYDNLCTSRRTASRARTGRAHQPSQCPCRTTSSTADHNDIARRERAVYAADGDGGVDQHRVRRPLARRGRHGTARTWPRWRRSSA